MEPSCSNNVEGKTKAMKKDLSVLHICAGDISWGAAKGALWLHQSLMECGVDSHFFIQFGDSDPDQKILSATSIIGNVSVALYQKMDRIPVQLYKKRSRSALFSPTLLGPSLEKIIAKINPDVIHLHWVNNGLLSMSQISKFKRPVVWTLRDLWPFTGGCHYSNGCTKYYRVCSACPILGSTSNSDLSSNIFKIKSKIYSTHKNLFPVAISKWIREEAVKSALFNQQDIKLIYNGIPCSQFPVWDKLEARKKLGLPEDKKLILFGAISSRVDPRKGWEFVENYFNFHQNEDEMLVTFGSDGFDDDSIPHISLGKISDTQKLSQIYSACDVFAAPSLEEAFGKTIVESLSCGTPVVSFDYSAPKELITHCENGYLAIYKDQASFDKGIRWCMGESFDKNRRDKMHLYVEENFNSSNLSTSYKSFYQSVLKN